MKKKITIFDYGLGNILSAEQSFKKIINNHNINAQVKISDLITEIKDSTHLVLPGQGAFRSCMNGLKKIKGMIDAIQDFALIQKKPFLGICVGMQLLADVSFENGKHLRDFSAVNHSGKAVLLYIPQKRKTHIFCTFLITCIVFPRFVWYFRLRRTDLNINGSARFCMLSTTLMRFFLLKRANNHSRPSKVCYPMKVCLLNTTAAIPLHVTHDKVAANILSEPLMQMITT